MQLVFQGHNVRTDCVLSGTYGANTAFLDPDTSILIQKRHPYTGNLNRETSGDSKNVFLLCGDVLDCTNEVSDGVG